MMCPRCQSSRPGTPKTRCAIWSLPTSEHFLPGLMTIATEFSRWQDSLRRLNILAIDKERNASLSSNAITMRPMLSFKRYATRRCCRFLSSRTWFRPGTSIARRQTHLSSWRHGNRNCSNFLGRVLPTLSSWGRIPRIVLISSQFNKEITTTVALAQRQVRCCGRGRSGHVHHVHRSICV